MSIQLKQYIRSQQLTDKLVDGIHQKEELCLIENGEQNKRGQRIKAIKKYMMGIGIMMFLIYRMLYSGQRDFCLKDVLQNITAFLNYKLNNDKQFYNMAAIITQQIVDIQIIFMIYLCIFKTNNMRIHLLVGSFYGLRAIYLNIQKIPYPEGYVSYAPNFPTFSVPYGITRDFYYSGHTGIMIISVIQANNMKFQTISRVNMMLTLVIVTFLIGTRVHYTIDIIGSIIFVLWINKHVSSQYIYFDKLWTWFFRSLESIYFKCINSFYKRNND